MLRAIEVVEKQASHAGLKAILSEIHRRVEDGSTLADAMARFQNVLGEMAVSMVRAGGEGGFLEEALARVAQFTETQDDLKKRTMGAIAYPAFLAVVGTIIVVVLVVFFVPKFGELFQQLREKGELPAVTEWLLATSAFLRRWGLLVLAALVGSAWWLRRWLRTEAGRWWADRLRLRLPLVGPVFLGLAVARFCRVFGTLLHNGVPIVRSLEISRDAAGNRVLAAAISHATENISAGQSLGGAPGGQRPVPARGGRNDRRRRAGQQPGNRALVRRRFAGTPHLAPARPDRAADRADHALDLGGHHPGFGDCPLAARAQDELDRVEWKGRKGAGEKGRNAMGNKIIRHTELDVYKEAFDAAMEIFDLSKKFPKEETYSLTDQIRRASRSVCANLAEGWRKRRYEAAFTAKLSDSEGEAAETQVWLQFAVKCEYLERERAACLYQSYDEILGMLVEMINHPEPWLLRGKGHAAAD